MSKYKSKILKNGSWVSLGFVIKSIAHFLISIFLTRLLFPTKLGDYFLLASLIPFVNILVSLGLPNTLVRIVPKLFLTDNYKIISKYYSSFLKVLFTAALIFSLIFILISSFFGELFLSELYSIKYYIVIVCWMISEILQSLSLAIFQSLHDQKRIVIFTEVFPKIILLLGCSIILIFDIDEPFFYILLLFCLSTILSFTFLHRQFLSFIKEKKNEKEDKLKVSLNKQQIRSIASPLWITSLMLFVITRFDLWLIGYHFSSDNVAIYALASKLIIMVNLVFMVSVRITAPMIAELYDLKKLKTLEIVIRLGATISIIPAVLFLIIFGLFGQEIIILFFGKFYISGWLILMILLIGVLANIFTGCTGTLLMYTSYQNLMMKITFISGVITLVLTLFLIKPYGLIGVACASSIGLTIQSILMYYFARVKTGILTHASFASLKHLKKSALL